jgi:drug/metabolite transporter (DMT)-like permease
MPLRSTLALVLAAACWGLGTVVSKRAVDEIPALLLLPVQLGGSVLALSALMRALGVPLRLSGGSAALGRLGLLNPGLAYALSLLGLASITASLSVLLWAAEPILIVVLAAIVLRERVRPAFVGLSLAAVTGMVLVAYEPGTGGALPGIVLTVAGVACCAVYTVAARRWISGADTTAQVVVAQQAWALGLALVLLAGAVATGALTLPGAVSPVAWGSAIASGLLYYGAAYSLYLSALRELPASSAAASFYLIPIFGLVGSAALLGERLSAAQSLGALVAITAVVLILRPGQPDRTVVAGGAVQHAR